MSDMPDFDSMTPEEMMRWMESLAKRQGATEGLTTSADMSVAEVAADDERLKDMGEYVPYGWTAEKWHEHLAKEEAAKASKPAAAQPPAEPVAAPVPPPEPEPVAASAPAAGDMPDFDSMTPEEMMRWMESLAKRQGATEGLTTSADMSVAEVSADDARLKDMGEYVPYGWTAEKWHEHLAKEEAAKASKPAAAQPPVQPAAAPAPEEAAEDEELAAALSGDVLAAPSFEDLFSGNNIIEEEEEYEYVDEEEEELEYIDEEEVYEYVDEEDFIAYDEEDTGAQEPVAAQNPMDWLVGLTGQEAEVDLSLDMDALSDLESLSAAQAGADPMDWLAGLAGDTGDALASLGALAGGMESEEAEEGSLEWLESLAKRQGAEEEELATAASLHIPTPASIAEDGPGYEPFSFETGTGTVQDDSEVLTPTPSFEIDDLDMEDPGSWLDQLASGMSAGREEEEDFFSLEEEEEGEPVAELETFEEEYEEITGDIMTRINTGKDVSPEEMQAFFEAQFRKAEQMPDDEEEEEEIEIPLQAQIPDWLRESMSTLPVEETAPSRTDTAELMIENLGLDEEVAEPAELPDWLAGGMEEDSGVLAEDIFASAVETIVPIEEPAAEALDTSDSWVQAFVQESTGEMENWYKHEVARLEGEPVEELPAVPAAAPAVAAALTGLEHIELPVESKLQAGEAQNLPDWLGGTTVTAAPAAAVEEFAITDEVVALDWLAGDEAADDEGMPDWLRDTVDDSAGIGEDLPDWLAVEEIGMIAADEIPDWLRETLDEEEEDLVDASVFGITPEPETEPVPVPQPVVPAPAPITAPVPVRQSPAPVPVGAARIDVAATLQSAQQKMSGGDIGGALLDYEAVVRANTALDQVESAVRKLADDKNQKGNPAVFRVLGDTLMRQGKLQEALDTYRKALNML